MKNLQRKNSRTSPALLRALSAIALTLVLVLFLALWAAVTSPSIAQAKTDSVKSKNIAELSWLAGKWQTKDQDPSFEEHWMRPRDGAMIGMGRELSGSRMEFFEYLRIEQRKGGLFYVAQPRGKTQTEFRLTHVGKTTLVFENPEHDFPKKIEYERGAGSSVVVRVSGSGKEKEKSFQHVLFKTPD